MQTITLEAKSRLNAAKARQLLRQGFVPGIVYGHGFENQPVMIAKHALAKVYREASQSSLIDLSIEGKEPIKVLIHDTQHDPITEELIHVDLYQVKMTEKIKTEIPLKLIGRASAVEELQGTLIQNKDHLRVEALPQDLVHEIEVNVAELKTFDDKIHVKNLIIPKGIELQEDPEEVVVLVQPPRSEEELAALVEKVEEKVEEVKVEEKGKLEEGVEGEVAEAVPEQPKEVPKPEK